MGWGYESLTELVRIAHTSRQEVRRAHGSQGTDLPRMAVKALHDDDQSDDQGDAQGDAQGVGGIDGIGGDSGGGSGSVADHWTVIGMLRENAAISNKNDRKRKAPARICRGSRV